MASFKCFIIIFNFCLYENITYPAKTIISIGNNIIPFNLKNDGRVRKTVATNNKLFSFSLFISNIENLSYLIGLVYNYAIMRKHFTEYKMRLYIDFHSVFGSPEAFNLFISDQLIPVWKASSKVTSIILASLIS